jgi:TonB family protein
MKDIGELLRETDPLRFESGSWTEQQKLQRQVLLRAASTAGIETPPRSEVPIFAIVAIALAALVSWIGTQSLFVLVGTLAVGRSQAQQEPYKVGEQGVTSPKLTYKVDPQYTKEARDARIEGTVILQAVVGKSGTVEQLSLEKGIDPGLDKNAMSAVKQWQFEPGRKEGQPVPVKATIEVSFKLP